MKNKREQKNQQKGSLKRLEKSAPEVKSAPVLTSSEARSPEAEVHQEMKNLRDSRAENMIWSRLGIAKDWKSITTTLEMKFESIWCLFYQERWQRTIVRIVQPLPPLLCSCLCYKARITALPAEMFLHTRNAFEIDPS